MDRNEAYKFLGKNKTGLDYIVAFTTVDEIYDNNCEIVDRSIPEEHIKTIKMHKEDIKTPSEIFRNTIKRMTVNEKE